MEKTLVLFGPNLPASTSPAQSRRVHNELEVSVVNLWPNRLIGDAALPAKKRFTETNMRKFVVHIPASSFRAARTGSNSDGRVENPRANSC